jgi:hypothetical protein
LEFCVSYSLDEIIQQPLKAAGLSKQESFELLIRIVTIQGILLANLARTPAENSKPKQEDDELISVEEAARILDVTPKWLYENKDKLALPYVGLSRKNTKFSRRSVQRWIAARVNRG